MIKLKQYYEILGVQPGASLDEIKQAYKDSVAVWHPDRFTNNERLQQKAQEKLKEINEAFERINAFFRDYGVPNFANTTSASNDQHRVDSTQSNQFKQKTNNAQSPPKPPPGQPFNTGGKSRGNNNPIKYLGKFPAFGVAFLLTIFLHLLVYSSYKILVGQEIPIALISLINIVFFYISYSWLHTRIIQIKVVAYIICLFFASWFVAYFLTHSLSSNSDIKSIYYNKNISSNNQKSSDTLLNTDDIKYANKKTPRQLVGNESEWLNLKSNEFVDYYINVNSIKKISSNTFEFYELSYFKKYNTTQLGYSAVDCYKKAEKELELFNLVGEEWVPAKPVLVNWIITPDKYWEAHTYKRVCDIATQR